MEQLVRVKKTFDNGTALVIRIRESACSGDCHKCSGCGAAKEAVLFTAANPIGAGRGDLVKVESETGPVLKAAVVLYVIPLVLFFLGYYLGTLTGGFAEGVNDHRMVMSAALGTLISENAVTVSDKEAIRKSYPGFFDDFSHFGVTTDVQNG